jgi:chromosomal replication initiation ATPase DnaA
MTKIFAIVGYTNWGKSHTLDELFKKKHFKPLLNPIKIKDNEHLKFIVIEASNEDRFTTKYLDRLRNVIAQHRGKDVNFVITISLMFDSKNHNVQPVFDFLNGLSGFEINYLLLNCGWNGGTIKISDLAKMQESISHDKLHLFNHDITRSKDRFTNRTDEIRNKIISLI